MSLRKSNTKWVLFLASDTEAEHRHIMDLAFGLQCLEASGIDSKDIFIYVDGQNRTVIAQLISNATRNVYDIKHSAEFFQDQKSNGHENLVLFVTGHGNISGIDASPTITPHMLLRCIKESPSLNLAIIYLGQCYAGIFNYIGAGRTKKKEDGDPEVVLLGATNLHESLSSSTKEAMLTGDQSWLANLFLLHVFKWISQPVDIDGDGRCTIIDSYKYAGVSSNNLNKNIKIGSFVRSIELHEQWQMAKNNVADNPSPGAALALKAIETQYETELNVRYVHQECWILNSIPAQFIEI